MFTRNAIRVTIYSPNSDYLKFSRLDVRKPHKYVAMYQPGASATTTDPHLLLLFERLAHKGRISGRTGIFID